MHHSKIIGFATAAVLLISGFSSFAASGSVTTDGLNIRDNAVIASNVIGTAYTGDTLQITGKDNNYYSINYNGSTAYVVDDYVSVNIIATGTVTTDILNIRSSNNTSSNVIGQLAYGDTLNITDKFDVWYEILINGAFGYVHSDYISADRGTSLVSRSGNNRSGGNVVEYSKSFLGVPYVSGGSSPTGFDCSGFTYYVYNHFGVSLPRTSSEQATVGIQVSRDNLAVGDLLFFDTYGGISHVGIYTGGDSFIHATVPGDVVKVSSLSSSYYSSHYVTARRVIR